MSNKKGFTLIEVIVSISTIVGIVATGAVLVRSYGSAMDSNQASIVAAGLARDLLNQSYDSRQNNPKGPLSVTFSKTIELNNIEYARTLSIETINDSSQSNQKYWQATAKVTWNSGGKPKEMTLVADVAKLSQ